MTIFIDTQISAPPSALQIEGQVNSMTELLDRLAERMGTSLAAIDEGGSITYIDLRERSRALARALARQGVTRGDRIGLLAGNGIDWLVVAFAGAAAGGTVVPFSTWSTSSELSFLITDAECKALFISSNFSGRDFTQDLAKLVPENGPRLISIGAGGNERFTPLNDFVAEGGADFIQAEADYDAMILYTSGSTSRPKGVRLTQSGVVENGLRIGDRMGLQPGDRVLLPVPLFWAYGGCNALPAAMTHGATLVLPSRFDASQALDLIERHHCTAIYTLPAITSSLLRHAEFRPARTESLRTGLTIGSPEDFRLASERLGIPELCNIYGATETYGNCAVTWHHWPVSRRASCQGPMLQGQMVRFRDPETGDLCPPGKTGLAEVSGRVSPGYFGQSESSNAEAFTKDEYYRTGDLGHLNNEGDFVFVCRATEMIKRAGINVSPAEIEDVLMQVSGVSEAAVTGVSNPARGELIVAYVVSEGLDCAEIEAHCRTSLSQYKLPDRIEITTSLPLTATGKLQRSVLRQMATDMIAQEVVL
jgi:fatty-acyl-CoA synthase